MFSHKKHSPKKLWITVLVLIGLVAATLIMQAKIMLMLQDLNAFVLRSFVPYTAPITTDWVQDSNPMPPVKPVNTIIKTDYVMDSNPMPPV